MKKFGLILLIAGLGFSNGFSQVYTTTESSTYRNDSLFNLVKKEKTPLSYSCEAWAIQTSNTITAGFMNTLAEGGFISRDFLDPILDAHTGPKGYIGATTGFNISWTSAPKKDKVWSVCGSFGSEAIVDGRWTTDFFELAWYGNASSTGEVNVLSGSGVRAGVFNRFSIGGYKNDTRQRIEISLVQRLVGAEWTTPYGYLYVSDNADSVESYVQSEARLHFGENREFTPAYGIGISGNVPIVPAEFPLEVNINFKDVGLLFEPEGSRVYWVQDGLTTTGLPVYGDSLTWESIYNGTVYTDSVVQIGTSVSRMVLLPAKLGVNLKYKYSDKIYVNGSVNTGGWMPRYLISGGLEMMRNDDLIWGVNYKDGGWGDSRFEIWAKITTQNNRVIYLCVEEPAGLFFREDTGAQTTCRGLTLRLER